MKKILNAMIIRALALLFAASVTSAQAFAQDRVPFRQEELDQMLAPVALYPDALLSQLLMASTYPLEVVQAARWSRANPGLKGQDAVRAVERMDWDPSVKSLTAFPQVISMMDEQLDWTERLGEAFLAQQADVMDAVQGLRRRAEAAGNLRSSEQMRVARQGEAIVIQQPAPEIVYVPYYDPVVAYGPWWWPAYPPFYWAPPVAYYVVPAHRPVFFWGPGIVISANFFFGHTDWHRRNVIVVRNTITHVTVNRATVINQGAPTNSITSGSRATVWQHDLSHRRGVPFRSEAARQRFEQPATDTRRDATQNSAQAVRRREDSRTADIRQNRLDERRNVVQDRREGHNDIVQLRRESTVDRVAPGDAHRPDQAMRRNEGHVRPAAQPETYNVQPKVTTPAIRADPRPAAAPVIRNDTRPAVVRSEPRPAPAAPVVRSEPRQDSRPAFRAEHRPEPRQAVNVERHVPRAGNNQHERSAGRDNGRGRDSKGGV